MYLLDGGGVLRGHCGMGNAKWGVRIVGMWGWFESEVAVLFVSLSVTMEVKKDLTPLEECQAMETINLIRLEILAIF
jgi:hypothetical protein